MTNEQQLQTNDSVGAAKLPGSDNWRGGLKAAVLYLSHTVAFLAGVEFACYLMLSHGGGR